MNKIYLIEINSICWRTLIHTTIAAQNYRDAKKRAKEMFMYCKIKILKEVQ